jgi:transposase-like protein
MTFTAEAIEKAHGPAARRKAIATMKRNRRAKKAKARGKTSMIDVSTLPSRPRRRSIARTGKRRQFTPQQRARIVAGIGAALAGGMKMRDAARKFRIHETQYRQWLKRGHLNGHAAVNGAALHDDETVRISVQLGGNRFDISIEEAVAVHAGLAQLLARTVVD